MSWLDRYTDQNWSTSDLLDFEGDSIALPKLDPKLAWEIGCCAVNLANVSSVDSGVVNITLASGQVLFHIAFGKDPTLDDDEWVRKNSEIVFRFGKSSYAKDPSRRADWGKSAIGDPIKPFHPEKRHYYCGGSVPIRLKGSKIVIGVLTVKTTRSGHDSDSADDHWTAIEALSRFAQVKQDDNPEAE